jgi:hypothetical protein
MGTDNGKLKVKTYSAGGFEGQEGINREIRQRHEMGNQLNIQQPTRNIQQPTKANLGGQRSEVGRISEWG